MRVCLIGCGDIANAAHGPALARLEKEGQVELSGCCNRRYEKAAAFMGKYGFKSAWSDYVQMLDSLQPDAVMVLLPVHTIAQVTIDVMKLGYPVIMEKPPGIDTDETDMLSKTAEELGIFNAVMFNRRSMPLVQRLKREISGRCLDAISLEMCRFNRTGGEDFTTTIIHDLDCVSFLTGESYSELCFSYDEHPEAGYTNYFVSGRLSGGTHVDMRFLPAAGGVTERFGVYAHGSQFYLDLPVWSGTEYTEGFDCPGRLVGIETQKKILDINGEECSGCRDGFVLNGFYDEDRILLSAIEKGEDSPYEIKSGRQSVEIMLAMRRRLAGLVWENNI
ncbi:Gfo/Idh/MocA family protein [Dysosmobacter sp.]|uniref:Gfo/Idh/MocA family protein n=1 Tax=Dysosmobacter sp. TaxID=2591382 RepID=UPI003AB113F0